jgi:DNA-binding CsgD family transcriptional regulator
MHSDALIALAAHWLFLWYGLYLLSRTPRCLATTLAAASMLCVSGYLIDVLMVDLAPTRASAVAWAAVFGMLPILACMLWFHAVVAATQTEFRGRRSLLAVGYACAIAVTVLVGATHLIYDYDGVALDPERVAGSFPLGPLYSLYVVCVAAPLGGAAFVAMRARRGSAAAPAAAGTPLLLLAGGTGLFLLGVATMTVNAFAGLPIREGYLQPALAAGALTTAYAFARYPGLLEGQLLWSDLKASLLATTMLMVPFAVLVVVMGGSYHVLVGAGWLLIAAYVLNSSLRAAADLPFFGTQARGDRADLITAARFAGAPASIDLKALSAGQAAGLIDYASELERAGVAWERLRLERDLWLELLAREEFAGVRRALGLPADWSATQPFPLEAMWRHVEETLTPRERLTIGYKYLGYSDREMAEMMGVKANVPRSYLSSAKAKLALSAGPSLMLFAHFSGVVSAEALPRLGSMSGATLPVIDGVPGAAGVLGASE